MSDISTSLYTQGLVRETPNILLNAIDEINGGSFADVEMVDFELPATAWGAYMNGGLYPYYANIEVPALTEDDTISLILSTESRDLGYKFSSSVSVGEGYAQIRCTSRPSHTLTGQYSINTLMVLSAIDMSLFDKLYADFQELEDNFLLNYSEFKNTLNTGFSNYKSSTDLVINNQISSLEDDLNNKFNIFKSQIYLSLEDFRSEFNSLRDDTRTQLGEFTVWIEGIETKIDGNIDTFEERLNLMEDQVFSRVDGQSYLIEFNTIDGINLNRGIFHEVAKRIEC